MLALSWQLHIMARLCKLVELAGAGFVINGATPSSFRRIIWLKYPYIIKLISLLQKGNILLNKISQYPNVKSLHTQSVAALASTGEVRDGLKAVSRFHGGTGNKRFSLNRALGGWCCT